MSSSILAGRYQLLHRLAQGGMAEVWLARQIGTAGFEKLVVVKRILPHLAADQEYRAMFLDEARTAADLRHPHVVQVLDVGEHDGLPFLVLEYLEGRDAAQIVRRCLDRGHCLPIEHACQIVLDAAAGLAYAHAKASFDGAPLGIVHRDVSPQNVVVTWDGVPKVVDFGVAKAQGRAQRTEVGTLKGKAAYMAPEQIQGGEVDHRADQFSLGVVLFELTTGRRLFLRDTPWETLQAIVHGEVPRPTSIDPRYPPLLEDVVLTALARRPDDRFESCTELEHALETFLVQAQVLHGPRRLATFMRGLFAGESGATAARLPVAAGVRVGAEDFFDEPTTGDLRCSVVIGVPVDGPALTDAPPQAKVGGDDAGVHAVAARAAERFLALDGDDGADALAALARDEGDIAAALDVALAGAAGDARAAQAAVMLALCLEALRGGRAADLALVERLDGALRLAEAAGLRTGAVARLLEARADVSRDAARLDDAAAHLLRALAIARDARDPGLEALVRRNLAEIEIERGDLDAATAHAEAARSLARRAGDKRLLGRAELTLGRALLRRGEAEQAAQLVSSARAVFREERDARFEGRALGELARVRHAQGALDEALLLYEEARAAHARAGERRHEGRALGNIGLVLLLLGEAAAAGHAFGAALALVREAGDARSEATLLGHLGSLLAASGRLDEARSAFSEALRRFDEVGDQTGRAAVLARMRALPLGAAAA